MWWWCLVYTAVVPAQARLRRRGELRNHLWESDELRLSQRAVAFAAARGLVDDILWTSRLSGGAFTASFETPTPYLVLAGAIPILVAVVAALARQTGRLEMRGTFVSVGLLVPAAAFYWRNRRHS